MDRRKYIVLVGGLATTGGTVSAVGSDSSSESEEDGDAVHDVGDDELYLISNLDELVALPFDPNIATELEGEGNRVTDEFELESGLTMFVYESEAAEYEGIEADLEQTDGDDSVIWAILEIVSSETTEVVTGGSLEHVEGGTYLLDVNSPGEWVIYVAQPKAPEEEVRPPPATVEGEHSAVVGPIEADNGLTVAGEHRNPDTDSTFDVLVFQEENEGFGMDYAFTEDAGFEGESRVDVDGVSWAYVNTRGEWSLEFSD